MKNTNKGNPHFYSNRLRQKLHQLNLFPVTIMEAPSGYGKTTAIRDYLESLPQGTPVFWFTAAKEAPASGFRRLCYEIDKIDDNAGQRLLKIGLPNSATVGEACAGLQSITCGHETYLVIDNFQFLQQDLPQSFFAALIEHGDTHLHVIIITQELTRDMTAIVESRGTHQLTASDLRLDDDDIQHFYALSGANISAKDASKIERCTEGWMIAVYLQLQSYKDTGIILAGTPKILTLMEHLVWAKLNKKQQTFLLRISPFATITIMEACTLNDFKVLPKYAADVLKSPFIRYDDAEQRYELHNTLSELLTKKRRESGADFERECLLRAGDLRRDDGKFSEALDFYWQIKDFERIVTLDFSVLITENIGSSTFSERMVHIAQNCPAALKRKYPLPMLRIDWALLLNGEKAEHQKLMKELRPLLGNDTGEGKNHLYGEWLLLSSFDRYPDLDQMTAVLKQAEPWFGGGCSQVILPSSPLCFGNYMIFSEFHRKPGAAEQEACALAEYIAVYARLTNGHGSGADALFRSILTYYRADFSNAEILAYKAAYLAESNRQSMILLGAAHVLAEIAVQKGDISGWQSAISAMGRAATSDAKDNASFRSAVDIVRGVLFCELQAMSKIAGWLKAGAFSENHVLPSMLNTARFVYFTSLHFQNKCESMIGKIEAVISDEVTSNLLFDMILFFLMAIGYDKINQAEKAQRCLEQAMNIAVPDGLLFPFVAYSWLLEGLPDRLITERYPSLKGHFNDLKKSFHEGWRALYRDIEQNNFSANLTEREFEVAKLAAKGMHNNEIAQKLCVSESTVRTHLRTVFQKLDIDRRAKLTDKIK